MLQIETVHHVSLPSSDLERSMRFYEDVLGLEPMERPAFDFKGKWYKVGDRSLHLIVANEGEDPTYRRNKPIDSHDTHFAIRVRSYAAAVTYLESKGFRASTERNPRPTVDNPLPMRLNPTGPAGFPQIYLLDPDHNVIEINASTLD